MLRDEAPVAAPPAAPGPSEPPAAPVENDPHWLCPDGDEADAVPVRSGSGLGIGERTVSSSSIMQGIRARMITLFERAPRRYVTGDDTGRTPSAVATPSDLAAAAVAKTATDSHGRASDKDIGGHGGGRRSCRMSFRVAIISAITLAVVLSCASMSLPLELFFYDVTKSSDMTCRSAISTQRMLINTLLFQEITRVSFGTILRTMGVAVERVVRNPANDAIDSLWATMRTLDAYEADWSGITVRQRRSLSYTSWMLLRSQSEANHSNLHEFGGTPTGQRSRVHAEWLYAAFASGQVAGAIISATGNETSALGIDSPAGVGNLTFWQLDGHGGRVEPPRETVPYDPTRRPYYTVQQAVANASAELAVPLPAKRLWSKLYSFVGERSDLGLSLTQPIAFCGDYSCFEGVVAADVTLSFLNQKCRMQWGVLRETLMGEPYHYRVGPANSSVFIVGHVSRFPEQEGVLIGVADDSAMRPVGVALTHAEESEQAVVRGSSRALRKVYGEWSSRALIGEQLIHFKLSAMIKENPEYVDCSSDEAELYVDPDCQAVGTISVMLDESTRWLVVVSLPVGAFSQKAVLTAQDVDVQVSEQKKRMSESVQDSRWLGLTIASGMALVCVALGVWLAQRVAMPLGSLSRLMQRLGDLDFDACGASNSALVRRSWILDVADLQDAYCRLSRSVEVFARFVPETVVRNIVRGDERATRLNVNRRVVTIMFSDIRDFTSITEVLSQCDLLFFLTRYLSVMTHIVELLDGVVAEILGDGLLVFWNTPDNVEDHAAKACAAALAQQAAINLLNEEFAELGLPEVGVRIGVHTGEVFTGNIGSEMKMKFGCMGDPMNTASRLEGLCRQYGVGIICSGATLAALPADARFLTRKLDLVQVKGKRRPIEIHEVMARDIGLATGTPAVDGPDAGSRRLFHSGSSAAPDPELGLTQVLSEATATSIADESCVARQALSMSNVAMRAADRLFTQPLKALLRRKAVKFFEKPSEEGDATARSRSGEPPYGAASVGPTPEQRDLARLYEEALEAYQTARFLEAIRLLEELLRRWPEDEAAANLLARTRRYVSADGLVVGLSSEELLAWDGCVVMAEK